MSLASQQIADFFRYAKDDAAFVTVGGHASGDKKHVGGHAVPVGKLAESREKKEGRHDRPGKEEKPTGKPKRELSDQEQNDRESLENADKVSQNPDKAKSRELHRALGHLHHMKQWDNRRLEKGEITKQQRDDFHHSADVEIEYYKQILKKRGDYAGGGPYSDESKAAEKKPDAADPWKKLSGYSGQTIMKHEADAIGKERVEQLVKDGFLRREPHGVLRVTGKAGKEKEEQKIKDIVEESKKEFESSPDLPPSWQPDMFGGGATSRAVQRKLFESSPLPEEKKREDLPGQGHFKFQASVAPVRYSAEQVEALFRYAHDVEYTRAPVGGATSPVNGQFYEGGWWMPIHGTSTKKKQEEKKTRRVEKVRNRMGDLVEVPAGSIKIESLVGGRPGYNLPDQALAYLSLTREQAKQLGEIFEMEGGAPYIPFSIVPPRALHKSTDEGRDWNILEKYKDLQKKSAEDRQRVDKENFDKFMEEERKAHPPKEEKPKEPEHGERYPRRMDHEFHGEQPPGDGWTQSGTGPRGGKIWTKQGKQGEADTIRGSFPGDKPAAKETQLEPQGETLRGSFWGDEPAAKTQLAPSAKGKETQIAPQSQGKKTQLAPQAQPAATPAATPEGGEKPWQWSWRAMGIGPTAFPWSKSPGQPAAAPAATPAGQQATPPTLQQQSASAKQARQQVGQKVQQALGNSVQDRKKALASATPQQKAGLMQQAGATSDQIAKMDGPAPANPNGYQKYGDWWLDKVARVGRYSAEQVAEVFRYVQDDNGREHDIKGRFTGHAATTKKLADDAIAELNRVEEDVMKKHGYHAAKLRKASLAAHAPLADKLTAHFKELAESVGSDEEAKDLAKELGYQSMTGSKEAILKQLHDRISGRLGAFVRVHASKSSDGETPVRYSTGRIAEIFRYAAEDEGKWLTIGGKEVPGRGKHVGGFPVQIDHEGKILKGGPKELRGKPVGEAGGVLREKREGRHDQPPKPVEEIRKILEENRNQTLTAEIPSSTIGDRGKETKPEAPKEKGRTMNAGTKVERLNGGLGYKGNIGVITATCSNHERTGEPRIQVLWTHYRTATGEELPRIKHNRTWVKALDVKEIL